MLKKNLGRKRKERGFDHILIDSCYDDQYKQAINTKSESEKVLSLPVVGDLSIGHEGLGVTLVSGASAAIEFRQVDEPATVTVELEAVGVGSCRKQLLVDVASVGCDAGTSS